MTEFKIYLLELVDKKRISYSRAIEIWKFFNEQCQLTNEALAWSLARDKVDQYLKESDEPK